MIYGARSNGNHHGLVLTKPMVVDAMLDRIGYVSSFDLSKKVIIEPAAGDGAFAVSIIKRLFESSKNFNFSFYDALSNVRLFEIDPIMAELLLNRIQVQLNEFSIVIPDSMIQCTDFLLSGKSSCDIVIGNPPYVRHENIPDKEKLIYRSLFRTFTHRSDLYIAFYEKSLDNLKNNGILSFICSNRWLKNQYGQRLRELIGLHYALEEVIDLEESNPFEEDVNAYPAITTIRKSNENPKGNYYRIQHINELNEIDQSIKPSRILNTRSTKNWFSYTSTEYGHEKYLDSIENQGYRIGIGVATGSDLVFIRQDFQQIVENELLLPILISKDLKDNTVNWSGNYIINPFSENGDLIDLEQYPKAKKYFTSNKELLLNRHISKKNPNLWYKTIDRISPSLTYRDKIILPDISGNTHLFIDRGNYYPHHNLYFITGKPYDRLVLLAAILMSDFIKNQLHELGNMMNGGYPRWQSQNLKKLRVPIIDSIPEESTKAIILAYHNKDYTKINKYISTAEISNYTITVGQTVLFEPEILKSKIK
jgi:adenine-specific DNA-methyltransferase